MTRLEDAYDQFGAGIYRHAVAMTRHSADAEDVVSAAFVRLAARLQAGLVIENLKAYLHRIAHNECLCVLDRRSKAPSSIAESDDVAIVQSTEDPDEAERVNLVLASLPDEQREVCVLHIFEGLTFAEIGQALSISPNTASSRYRYAREKLSEHLEPSNETN